MFPLSSRYSKRQRKTGTNEQGFDSPVCLYADHICIPLRDPMKRRKNRKERIWIPASTGMTIPFIFFATVNPAPENDLASCFNMMRKVSRPNFPLKKQET